ncbi:hypothetical protein LINPERPRIM_LOCUS18145 [Linum perenne]
MLHRLGKVSPLLIFLLRSYLYGLY